ncbi:DUF2550 domain-containing protein [Actinomycetospora lutea]|uniref:DUF2550 domain-containing protein n=1 Tax=Actinomycetospora lutea TaxID=663604 RepID=UPI0023656B9D|nr:DUF2550 domain-containing protein [Actinomycetospora lutea]MDD7941667.1 DUF2550 domain-containing protein [Actinomycetospora lutea]
MMIAELAAIVVLAVLLVVLFLLLRRVRLLRRGGVDVALREKRVAGDGRGWHSGLGRYRGDEFRWYRISGLRSGPNVVLDRTRLEIVDRRAPVAGEMHPPGSTVLSCREGGREWELAIGADALTGFSSWLESIPPGRSTGYRQAS